MSASCRKATRNLRCQRFRPGFSQARGFRCWRDFQTFGRATTSGLKAGLPVRARGRFGRAMCLTATALLPGSGGGHEKNSSIHCLFDGGGAVQGTLAEQTGSDSCRHRLRRELHEVPAGENGEGLNVALLDQMVGGSLLGSGRAIKGREFYSPLRTPASFERPLSVSLSLDSSDLDRERPLLHGCGHGAGRRL